MTPRHRTDHSPRLRFAPWLVVALVVVVLAGGATAALELTGGAGPAPSTAVSSSAAPGTSVPGESAGDLPTGASATPGTDRSTESARAARGADRAATTSSPTPPASPTPTAARPSTSAAVAADSPAGSGARTADSTTVVDSGTCGASYYASGQVTANGESFDPSGLTAAHRTLAFGTKVRVTNPQTGAAVVVRINDRGPFVDGRCLDLARGAFEKIAALAVGHLEVRYEILGD